MAMFWQKKTTYKTLNTTKKDAQLLIKPSPRPQKPREKRIEMHLPCYLLVEETGYFMQTTTLNISKTGLYVRSLKPMETGLDILCVISDKKNLARIQVKSSKYVMKGRIVRLVKEEMLCKMAIQITLGRVDPLAFLGDTPDGKFWWTRHWQ